MIFSLYFDRTDLSESGKRPICRISGHRFPEEKLPEAGSGVPPGKSRGGAFTASAPRNLTVIR